VTTPLEYRSINIPTVSTVPSTLTAEIKIPLHHARYLQAFDPRTSANPGTMFLITGCGSYDGNALLLYPYPLHNKIIGEDGAFLV